jgi:hypothetical protein
MSDELKTRVPAVQIKPLGKPGGKLLDPAEFKAGELRADLYEMVSRHCFKHAVKIVDELLADFDVTPKNRVKKKAAS